MYAVGGGRKKVADFVLLSPVDPEMWSLFFLLRPLLFSVFVFSLFSRFCQVQSHFCQCFGLFFCLLVRAFSVWMCLRQTFLRRAWLSFC